MDLYLMRHGESLSRQEAGVESDDERPLSNDGLKIVQRVAAGLRATGVRADRAFVSPLRRARETAEHVVEALGVSGLVETSEALAPDRDPRDFLDQLQRLKEPLPRVVLVIGHQPLLGYLAGSLVSDAPREGFSVRPAGVVWVQLPEFPRSAGGLLGGVWTPESWAG